MTNITVLSKENSVYLCQTPQGTQLYTLSELISLEHKGIKVLYVN